MYLKRMPALLRALAPAQTIWSMPAGKADPAVYLTFDDGPHPVATPYALSQLQTYDAKATFFCLGKNVASYPALYQQILEAGHSTGNHTHNHLKGWKTPTAAYITDTLTATKWISSTLFRPPYGRIRRMQARGLQERGFRIIMWSLLSGDFDTGITGKTCLENVIFSVRPGDIVVFHDSEKAWERMQFALPRVLEYCVQQGWALKSL